MADKGGKKFTPVNGPKTSLNYSQNKEALNRKDGSSSKAKNVHFESLEDSEASPRVGSEFSAQADGKVLFRAPVGKGDSGKGGKSFSMGKGGGRSTARPVERVVLAAEELKLEDELPKNAKCLMDCEAAAVLEGIQEKITILSEDPSIKIPDSFSKGLQYAKAGSCYTSADSVRQVLLFRSLKRNQVSDGEICMIANTCPETVDEVFCLIPSLKAKRMIVEEPIRDALNNLEKLKQYK